MSENRRIVKSTTEFTAVPVDTPARRVAAELATHNIRIMMRFGDDNGGNLRDLALLEEDFATAVLRHIKSVIEKEMGKWPTQ